MEYSLDIVIIGGGLVGAASAVALARQGHQVGLVEHRTPKDTAADSEEWDSRIYVISPGNVEWLKALGVWDMLDPGRICPIEDMEVWGDANVKPLELRAYEANVAHLGFVSENEQLQKALWTQLKSAGVNLFMGSKCVALDIHEDYARIELANHTALTSKLVLAADGANSWVRACAGITTQVHDYEQMAVVANFETEFSHQNTARQWFDSDGILAWLPLPGKRISMVWSTSNEKAAYLVGLGKKALAAEVGNAGENILGKLRQITPAAAFPLSLQIVQSLVRPRLVLVGDSAHQIHPLAGQGVNLGFRDVIALTRVLDRRGAHQDIGDITLLRHYERERKTDMLAMKHMTHGLKMLFADDRAVVKRLRNWGMRMTDSRPILKKQLIRQAII